MKSKLNIKSILIMAIIGIFSLMFLGKSFAAVTGKVNVETANIRETTEKDSNILEQASKGESVEVVEKNGNWYKVKYNGVQGYVREDLLDVTGSVTETGVTENTTTAPTTTETKQEETTKVEENTSATVQPTEQTTPTETTTQEQPVATTSTEADKKDNILEGMYITKSDVNLKLIPLVNGNNIKEIKKDATISVLGVYNNWALAESGLERGWVLFSKIQKVDEKSVAPQPTPEENKEEENKEEEAKAEEKEEEKNTEVAVAESTMYINWDLVNLREQPSKESEAITSLTKATEVTVFAKDGEWSKVRVNGKEGYIKTSLLSDTKPETTTSRSLDQERQPVETDATEEAQVASQPVSAAAGDVCSYAKQFLGCNYVYGGTSPSGFDCSGFTQYVYRNFGVDLNRTAEAQASNGTYVPKSELQAGDLLIFTHHAGIYLGDGTFIHAANSGTGVVITDLDESYYVRNYITARRVL